MLVRFIPYTPILSIRRCTDILSPSQIEPTESEGLRDIDQFCDAMIQIRGEIDEIISGKQPRGNNTIVNAPHPQQVVISDKWDRFVLSLFLAFRSRRRHSPSSFSYVAVLSSDEDSAKNPG
jgi:hypothetical protein